MPCQIIRNDITRVHADVIVNTANPHPVIGHGTDSAVYAAAGREQLLAARRNIGELAPGSVAATPAFQLPARYIIHTVGPVWTDGNHGERDILRACYARSMALADELGAQSMAFPLIATGVYAFPKEEALGIALSEIGRFLLGHDMMIFLDIGAGGQPCDQSFVKLTVLMVFNRFNTCSGLAEFGIMNTAFDRILAAGCAFCIHQKGKTVFKG